MNDDTPTATTTSATTTAPPVLKDWRLNVDVEKIAWATFDREGESANSLGRRPLELEAALSAVR